jgi:hypothetical protein
VADKRAHCRGHLVGAKQRGCRVLRQKIEQRRGLDQATATNGRINQTGHEREETQESQGQQHDSLLIMLAIVGLAPAMLLQYRIADSAIR